MKRKLLAVAVLMSAWNAHSQVGIGTLTPNKSSQLDVVANDKGVLLPRVALTSTTDTTTITNGNVNSLLVYNTNTQNDVTPGYYYWFEDKWMRIVNEDEIIALDKNTTNVSLTTANDELVLTDSDGNIVSIPLAQINIPTTLVNNNDGTYTYTNESGATVTIDVPSDVIGNIEQILGDTNVLNELVEVLGDTYVGGNVYYDGTEFTYVDAAGDTHVINFADIVQANETVTMLVNNNDGTYTYTSEDGTVTTVDIPSDIVNQFENIVKDGPVTVDGDTYNTIEEYIQHIVETNESVTTLVNNNDGTYTYTSEDGTVTVVDVPSDIVNQFENIVKDGPVTVDGNTYNTIEEYIQHLVEANETVTTLVNNNDGTYTYTSEDGTVTTVDVPSDIVNQFGNIVNNGPVTVDSNTYNTIEEYIEAIVKQNETLTSAAFDSATGILTYNDEAGTSNTIDLSAMVSNFETLTSISQDAAAGTITYVDEAGTPTTLNIADIIAQHQTVTTLVNNNDGTYTYTSEDGTVTTVDVPSDIANQFENIVKDGPATVDGDTYNTIEEYIQPIVETHDTNNTNASITTDGTNLVITDSDSNTVEVALADIAAEVDTNTISVVTPVITTGNTIATHDDGAGTTVEIKESITVLSYDEDEKELTYVDEEGEDTVIDIAPTASNGLTVGTGTHSDKDVKL